MVPVDDMNPSSASSMDGPSIAALLKRFQTDPEYEPLLELRQKRSIHLYQGFTTNATTLKLACLLFDHVTISELSQRELEYLDGSMDGIEPGGRAAAGARRRARMMLRKAARFQEETRILRDENVLVPFQWEGGTASMFQPACIGFAGQLIYLGTSEMHELASDIAGSEVLDKIDLFHTTFGLSSLREHVPEDIVRNEMAVAIAISEIVGLTELFQMTPVGSDLRWHRALAVSMSSRERTAPHGVGAALGMSILKAALPNIELRSYEDTLEARLQLRDELLAFRFWLSQQARQGKAGSTDTEIAKTGQQVTASVQDLQRKLSTANRRFLKETARNLITASPPAVLGYLLPSLDAAIGNAIAGLIAGWGVWDAVKDRREAHRIEGESDRAVAFLLKLQRRLG